ncbi:MAG TPA: OmpA family protein, partial [Kofleriaceae bacterium]|nr:OmpA family protein [Kofleriaceae bacterium]
GDADGDGLSNAAEGPLATDPLDADSDDDGILDGDEPGLASDDDGDGAHGALDPDSDGDGLLDGTEVGVTEMHGDTDPSAGAFAADADPTTTSDPLAADTDGGGVPDGVEDTDADGARGPAETDPTDPSDDYLDSDGDGLPDTVERAIDSDEDGTPDYLDDDSDGDGLSDADEAGDDDPTTPPVDSDGDGTPDYLDIDSDGDARPDTDDDCPTLPDPCSPIDPDPDPDGGPDAGAGLGFDVELGGGGCSAGGGGASGGGGALLVLLLAAALRVRRAGAAAALAIALGAAPAPAAAQDSEFQIERFRPAVDDSGILDVESGLVPGHLAWGVGMWFGHADDPLVAYRSDTGERIGSIIGARFGGELIGWVALWDRVELGAVLPLVLAQDGAGALDGVDMPLPALTSGGVGQLRLTPKVRIAGDARGALAVLVGVALPTGDPADYLGDDGVTVTPELAGSVSLGRARLGLNLGVRLPGGSSREVMGAMIGEEVTARAGAAVALGQARRAELALTASAATAIDDPFARRQTALEVLGGPTLALNHSLSAFAGGGVGLSRGVGTPDWRLLGGIRVTARPPPAGPTSLASEAALAEGAARAAPRRSRDPDGDGMTGAADRCPGEPERDNGHEDHDGCPDELPDADGDGVADARDGCLDQPEDVDGFEDDDGCPELDNDADGVVDSADGCPGELGPPENRGCPDADRDGDTVVDRLDTCPDERGTPEQYGCAAAPRVHLAEDRLVVRDRIEFESDSAALTPSSRPILDEVAALLGRHPTLRIEIQGHTDDRGPDDHNLDLSRRRAERVAAYLVERGVARDRLSAIGLGESQPRYDNQTRVGRAANRRVELVIARP